MSTDNPFWTKSNGSERPGERRGQPGQTPQPARWIDRPADGCAAEDRLASLLRQAGAGRGLDPRARSRVLMRLTSNAGRRSPRRMLHLALAALVLFSSGAVVASVGLSRWLGPQRPLNEAPSDELRRRRPVRAKPVPAIRQDVVAEPAAPVVAAVAPTVEVVPAAQVAAAANMVPEPTALAPGAARSTVRGTARRAPKLRSTTGANQARVRTDSETTVRRVALAGLLSSPAPSPARGQQPARPRAEASSSFFPIGPPPPSEVAPAPVIVAPPSPLAIEASMLRQALHSLRGQDGSSALAELDNYLSRFPDGVLRHEARIARVDALLLLGRESEALRTLDSLVLSPQGRELEFQVIRAELRSKRHCAAAIADFTQVLSRAATAALAERALHGRAACRLHSGDTARAQQDLITYLDRFPNGRFADDAQAALDRLQK